MCRAAALRVADTLGFLLADHAGPRFADLGEDFLGISHAGSTAGEEVGGIRAAVLGGMGGGAGVLGVAGAETFVGATVDILIAGGAGGRRRDEAGLGCEGAGGMLGADAVASVEVGRVVQSTVGG